jgi:hypothetical protein
MTVSFRNLFALAPILLAACDKANRESAADVGVARPSQPVAAQPEDRSYRFPPAARLVAIGDVHGDVRAALGALRLGGAIDEAGKWIGGQLVVVQTGDQLDRGDDEPEILDLFERLRGEAKAAGGAFFALNGNHEVMNVQGDFRYVTEDGFRDWSKRSAEVRRGRSLERISSEQRGRAAAFLPGGEAARRLAKQPVVVQVGENVFVHGGLLERHVNYGLARINHETRKWMEAEPGVPAPAILIGDSAPIWSREYSQGTPRLDQCQELAKVLDRLSAKRLIVGHTVQPSGINSACGGKVFRIDVGLARHYGGKPSVLEIRDGKPRVIQGEASTSSTPSSLPRPMQHETSPAAPAPAH